MLLRFPFDLVPLVRVGSFKVRSLSPSSWLFELAAGSLGVQRLLLIDGMPWACACWLWHFQTAHFRQRQRAKAMGLTAIFSKTRKWNWPRRASDREPGHWCKPSKTRCRQPRSQGRVHPICSSWKEWSTPAPRPGSGKPSCTEAGLTVHNIQAKSCLLL